MRVVKKIINKERGLSEYKLKGKPLTDVYGTLINIQDTSGVDESIWVEIRNPEQKFKINTGQELFPFFRLNKKKAKQLIEILRHYIEEG